jgi:hypothetical protein
VFVPKTKPINIINAVIDSFLSVVTELIPTVKANFVKLNLNNDGFWAMTATAVEDSLADALFLTLPPPTCVVRFPYTMLLFSDNYQLKCIPCGGMHAPEIPSMQHYPTLGDLESKLKEIGVVYPDGKIDPVRPVILKATDLRELGFDVSKFC